MPSSSSPTKKPKPPAETCPSFRRGSYPNEKDVERLRSLTAPHIDSFNYFLDVGLSRGVNDIEPAELDLVDPKKKDAGGVSSINLADVSTIQFWIEDVKVMKPSKSGSGRSNRLLPRESRERKIMYSGQINGKFCYKIIQRRNGISIPSKPVKLPKTFGALPIMILSKACHLHDKTPMELVKCKEEVCTACCIVVL